jgi:hypothetical protein
VLLYLPVENVRQTQSVGGVMIEVFMLGMEYQTRVNFSLPTMKIVLCVPQSSHVIHAYQNLIAGGATVQAAAVVYWPMIQQHVQNQNPHLFNCITLMQGLKLVHFVLHQSMMQVST